MLVSGGSSPRPMRWSDCLSARTRERPPPSPAPTTELPHPDRGASVPTTITPAVPVDEKERSFVTAASSRSRRDRTGRVLVVLSGSRRVIQAAARFCFHERPDASTAARHGDVTPGPGLRAPEAEVAVRWPQGRRTGSGAGIRFDRWDPRRDRAPVARLVAGGGSLLFGSRSRCAALTARPSRASSELMLCAVTSRLARTASRYGVSSREAEAIKFPVPQASPRCANAVGASLRQDGT
jgi:hypothetical protein